MFQKDCICVSMMFQDEEIIDSVRSVPSGRSSRRVSQVILNELLGGAYAVGGYLPRVLDLGRIHQVSPETARRALKQLEDEGFIVSVRGHGYRVLPKVADPLHGCPLALVMNYSSEGNATVHTRKLILDTFQHACAQRGWPMLGLDPAGHAPSVVLDRIRANRAFGIVLDRGDPVLVRLIREAGIPCVIVDAWVWDSWMDSVMQDGEMGGVQAVEYLLAQGCRRIAWFGTLDKGNPHGTDRLGGVLATLRMSGLPIRPELQEDVKVGQEMDRARALLKSKNRPDGIVAPWQVYAIALKQAADELGLVVGKDFHLVGWSVEEIYDSLYASAMGAPVPPTITWSARTLSEAALSRLSERRTHPDLPALRIKIPTRLRLETGKK